MARSEAVSLRVEEHVKRELQAAAKADGRTVAQYVERVLVSHLGQLREAKPARRS